MREILLDWASQPLSLFFLSLPFIVVCAVLARRAPLLSGGLMSLSLVSLMLFSSPMFANFLVGKLEGARSNPCWCPTNAGSLPIVVLGGGLKAYVQSDSAYDILADASLRRASRAAQLGDSHTRFYLVGGGSGRLTEAELMGRILTDQGIELERITLEKTSRSTVDNAAALADLFNSSNSARHIALVTSSMHVPRASQAFERYGFEVCHYDTDVRYAESKGLVALLPYVDALNKSTDASHELIGSLWIRLRDLLR